MAISKSAVFINEPVQIIVERNRSLKFHKVVNGSEVYFFYKGQNEDNAVFGLTTDFNAPTGASWTQLLVRDDEMPRRIAKILYTLKIGRGKLQSSTRWDGEPIIDIAKINRYLRNERQAALDKGNMITVSEAKRRKRTKLKSLTRRQAIAA